MVMAHLGSFWLLPWFSNTNFNREKGTIVFTLIKLFQIITLLRYIYPSFFYFLSNDFLWLASRDANKAHFAGLDKAMSTKSVLSTNAEFPLLLSIRNKGKLWGCAKNSFACKMLGREWIISVSSIGWVLSKKTSFVAIIVCLYSCDNR